MRAFLLALSLGLLPGLVRADEISGDWCSALGRHLRIEGDEVVTPGGQRTHGIYSRHAYEFIIPDGEADAGLTIQMRQLSEERVLVQIGEDEVEEWSRCAMVS
jgi:hypothetical protein